MLLPAALRLGLSANAVSIAGFLLGAGAAYAYLHAPDLRWATIGFALLIGWLIADGLDGMIARATGSASAVGRILDGVCDHGVFVLLYLALAASIGTTGGWWLAVAAGVVHAIQATLFEGERTRFHRRIRGDPGLLAKATPSAFLLARLYDALAGSLDRLAEPFDRLLGRSGDPAGLGRAYGDRASPPLRLLSLLSNNMRVLVIFAACLAGDVRWFWWIELVPLTLIAVAGIVWHRRVEARLVREAGRGLGRPPGA
jgi:phosphatidylglycerophosphate synthase